jgi:hypothetical protein
MNYALHRGDNASFGLIAGIVPTEEDSGGNITGAREGQWVTWYSQTQTGAHPCEQAAESLLVKAETNQTTHGSQFGIAQHAW